MSNNKQQKLSSYQNGILTLMKEGYKLEHQGTITGRPFLFKNGRSIPIRYSSIEKLISKGHLTNEFHPKLKP